MNYKIKAQDGGRGPILEFEVEAPTLVKAREEASKKLKAEGFPYARVGKITELRRKEEPSPAENTSSNSEPMLEPRIGDELYGGDPAEFGAERTPRKFL